MIKSKKAIITTFLVIQLILLVLLTFSVIKFEKGVFLNEMTVTRISAFRLGSTFDSLEYDINYLDAMDADNETMSQYIYFVNSTFNDYFSSELSINKTHLEIKDPNLEIQKVSDI